VQQFRKRNPADADEAEFMDNIFDALCSAASEANNKRLFLQSEGIDLCLLIMK
jgi:beta-catenin-like protein 1